MSRKSVTFSTALLLAGFSALCFVISGSYSVSAQVTSGTISGSVSDKTGALVSNASVTVTNPQTGVERKVTSGNSGEFTVTNLQPGTYSVTVEAQGFKKLEKNGLVLSAGSNLNPGELVLEVGAVGDSVTVTADSGQVQLQSNSGERSDVITSKQLNDVAINGRNVLDYLKLVPGFSGTFDGHASGTGGNDSYNINGTRANQHEFTIDGASNVDTGNNGGTHVTINTDAIEEVKVLSSNYQAEYGKAAGGQIALTTKGGTNEWHGNGRFFHRHEGLNANEWFNKNSQLDSSAPHNDPEIYRYNYVGYQIGGPIKKDKLFVFWSQEFYRQLIPSGGPTQFYTPTALERNGDFSQSVNGDGLPIEISGPAIVNNKIDPTLLSPADQAVFAQVSKILNLFPLPNVAGYGGSSGHDYNFSKSFSAENPRREDILRIDYQINGSNRIYGRWIHNSDTTTAPYENFPGPFGIFACSSAINFEGGCTQKHPGWNLSLNLVSTITPTLLNELSVGPSHTLSIAESVNNNISRGTNGIDFALLYPLSPSESIPDFGFQGLDNTNFAGSYLGGTPWKQANTTINVNDNITWVRQNHTFKAGMFYQRSRKDQPAWGNINGQFTFGTGPTSGGTCSGGAGTCKLGDPIASALLGQFDGFSQSTARPLGKFRYNQLEFYVQDTWKVTPRFTLDYGMRFAWIPPQYDADSQVALFDPASYDPANAVTILPDGSIDPNAGGDRLNGMRFTASGQLPDGGWNSRGIMPEPRVGFAYDLFGTHKTVLRGGAGMMHDRTQGNLIFNTVFNNPAIVQTASVGSGTIPNLPTQQGNFGNGVLSNILGADRNGQVPTVYSFSLGIQHELDRNTTLDVAYVGTLSRHLVTSRDINAAPYGAAFARVNQDPNCVDNQDPAQPVFPGGVIPAVQPGLQPEYAAAGFDFNGFCTFGFHNFSSAYIVPYKGYGQISYLRFDGTANYNSLQASLQRRFGQGLTFGLSYTFSKSLTTATSDQDVQDTFNALLDYRAASWDRTHVFAASYVYDLPNVTKHFGGPQWLSYITDHYQLSGVTQFMTGTPVDLNNNYSFPPGSISGSDQYGAIPYYFSVDSSGNPIVPTPGQPNRGTRDFFRNGGMQTWDMSLFKNIPFGKNEARYIQLRLEAFNAFNHPNFSDRNFGVNLTGPWAYASPTDPLTISKNGNWGTFSNTYGTGPGGFRVVQLGAKIYF